MAIAYEQRATLLFLLLFYTGIYLLTPLWHVRRARIGKQAPFGKEQVYAGRLQRQAL